VVGVLVTRGVPDGEADGSESSYCRVSRSTARLAYERPDIFCCHVADDDRQPRFVGPFEMPELARAEAAPKWRLLLSVVSDVLIVR